MREQRDQQMSKDYKYNRARTFFSPHSISFLLRSPLLYTLLDYNWCTRHILTPIMIWLSSHTVQDGGIAYESQFLSSTPVPSLSKRPTFYLPLLAGVKWTRSHTMIDVATTSHLWTHILHRLILFHHVSFNQGALESLHHFIAEPHRKTNNHQHPRTVYSFPIPPYLPVQCLDCARKSEWLERKSSIQKGSSYRNWTCKPLAVRLRGR